MFKINLHPYWMHLDFEGLSHALKNSPPDCFVPSLRSGRAFESHLSRKTKKNTTRKGGVLFGARDGTRTHTALTTRTSNVLVYHSNTLASAPQYYTAAGTFCQ